MSGMEKMRGINKNFCKFPEKNDNEILFIGLWKKVTSCYKRLTKVSTLILKYKMEFETIQVYPKYNRLFS